MYEISMFIREFKNLDTIEVLKPLFEAVVFSFFLLKLTKHLIYEQIKHGGKNNLRTSILGH